MKRILVFISVPVMLFLGIISFILFTTPGLRLALSLAPQGFSALVVQGNLAGGFVLENINYTANGFTLDTGELQVDWRLSGLLTGTLPVRDFTARNVTLNLVENESGGDSAVSTPVSLPVDFSFEHLGIHDIRINQPGPGEPLNITQLDARFYSDNSRLFIDEFRLSVNDGFLALEGNIDINTGPRFDLHADWSYQAGNSMSFEGESDLDGDLSQAHVVSRLHSPYAVELDSDIKDLLGSPSWEARVSSTDFDLGTLDSAIPAHPVDITVNGRGTLDEANLSGSIMTAGNTGLNNAPGNADTTEYGIDNLNLELTLEVNLETPDSPDMEGTIDINNTILSTGAGSGSGLSIDSGRIEFNFSDQAYSFSSRSAMTLNGNLPASLESNGSGDLDSLRLDNFVLELGQGTLQGTLALADFGASMTMDGRAEWENLLLPINDDHSVRLSDGNLDINGNLDDYTLTSATRISYGDIAPVQLTVSAAGNSGQLRIHSLDIIQDNSRVNGIVTLNWTDGLTADLDLQGEGINPERYLSGWPGDLAFESSITVDNTRDNPVITIDQLDITGHLREYPMDLQLESVIEGEAVDIKNATLTSGRSTVKINGTWSERKDISWSVNSPDLGNLYKDANGQLDASGRFSGSLESPVLSGTIQGRGLESPWLNVEMIDSSYTVNQGGSGGLNIRLDLTNLLHDETHIEKINLVADGELDDHRYDIRVTSPEFFLNVGGQGAYTDRNWQARTDLLEFEFSNRLWGIRKPFILDAGLDRVSYSDLCLGQGRTLVCSEGNWSSPNGWVTSASVTDMPFEILNKYLPNAIRTSGYANAELAAEIPESGPLWLNAEMHSASGNIQLHMEDNEVQNFAVENLNARLDLKDGVLNSFLEVRSFNDVQEPVLAELRVLPINEFPPELADLDVDGRLKWRVNDLSFFSTVSPYIADARGSLDVDLSVGGKFTDPQISGNLLVNRGGMMFPEYGVELSDITLTGRSTSNDIFEVNGRARSGDGTFTINSSFLNDEDAGPAISVAIQGDNIELINIPEVRAHAATDLTLDITREKNGIEGKVEIKNSLVNLDEIRETATLSPDVIMADEAVDENKPARTEINLSISLGDNVRIKGQGISGRLSGDVTMVSSENGELIGNGEIRIVDGKYSAYGQSLEIQEGRVIFSNYPMDNPELRIRAIRRINSDITAGLTVTGFFSNPQVSLISTPSMADEEILSYIVFGRPLASLTSGEGTNLIGAATALGVKNSGLITQSLSSTFGLDQLELTSDADGQNASVTVGKYVTPKIYISYIIGLLESVNTARILYNISESWSLEAKSSNESMGVDLLYRIEK